MVDTNFPDRLYQWRSVSPPAGGAEPERAGGGGDPETGADGFLDDIGDPAMPVGPETLACFERHDQRQHPDHHPPRMSRERDDQQEADHRVGQRPVEYADLPGLAIATRPALG